MTAISNRIIGIRHRVKKTAAGEARPTRVCIAEDGKSVAYDLEDEQSELDFVRGRFPVAWRQATPDEDLSAVPARFRKEGRKSGDGPVPMLVASEFDGLRAGDLAVMTLGGSGDALAFALSRGAAEVGARIVRVTPKALKEKRGEASKKDDSALLAEMAYDTAAPLWDVEVDDRQVIELRKLLNARMDAMKARIGCEQRLRQRFIGAIFCTEEGGYPEGALEDRYEAVKANDRVLQALLAEEKAADKALTSFVTKMETFRRFFEPVKGCGPMIAARIISDIGDIRRFESDAAFKCYCGVHVRPDGSFPRNKRGEGYSGAGQRTGFYLLGTSFVKMPKSEWGMKYRAYRAKFLAAETTAAEAEGRSVSTKGHHSKAFWRTVTKFAERLWRDWYRYETARRGQRMARSAPVRTVSGEQTATMVA